MGKEYHTWEATGGLTAVDAFKNGVIAGTTETKTFLVPDGKPHLETIIPAGVSDGAVTGASTFWMRLKGSAKIRTAEILLSGFGATLATTHSTVLPLKPLTDMGIQLTPGSQLEVEFGMFGEDSATLANAGATLVFSDREPKDGWFEYIGREILLTAVDTAGELQFQGLGTGVSQTIAVPSDVITPEQGGLDRIIAVVASKASTTGAAFFTMKLSESGVVFSPEFIIGSHGGTHATEANGHVAAHMFKNMEIDVRKSNVIIAKGLMAGTGTGNAALGASFGFKIPQK